MGGAALDVEATLLALDALPFQSPFMVPFMMLLLG